MKKMPCLFKRMFNDDHTVTLLNEVTEGCEWVLRGEGEASVKIDGTACAIIGGELYARYDCQPSKSAKKRHKSGTEWKLSDFKTPPNNSVSCQDPDIITGHWPHWVKVEDQPEYKYHQWGKRNIERYLGYSLENGTYELIGPKVGGNPEKCSYHLLVKHGEEIVTDLNERTFDGIREWLENNDVEGLVFKHQDGRMCKIRRRDYGIEWPT